MRKNTRKKTPPTWQQLLRRNCLISSIVYLASWGLGIFLALRFLPASVVARIDMQPVQNNAWLYISHNLQLELLFLVGACTLGIAPIVLLVFNGCLDGILVTAVARHAGLSLVLAGLLPHGIPEALAWIILGTCSLLLSRRLRLLFFSRPQPSSEEPPAPAPVIATSAPPSWLVLWQRLPRPLTNIYSSLSLLAALLIVIAGILEATVSPWLMHTLR